MKILTKSASVLVAMSVLGASCVFADAISNAELKNKEDIVSVVKKNCNDIATLKKAVAKLIGDVETLKQQHITLGNQHSKPALQHKKRKMVRKWATKSALPLKGYNKNKSKIVCKKIKLVIIDKKKIKHSYVKYKTPKTFTVSAKKAYIYDYPVLYGTKIVGKMKRGEKFVADMFTYPGWVHVKGKGWVRGFKLYPKVLYDPKKVDTDKKHSAIRVKVKTVCEKIK